MNSQATEQPHPIRVLLADDHEVVRAGVRAMLEAESDFQVIGEASDSASTIRQARKLDPHIVLLDLIMPDSHAPALIRQLRELPQPPEVVILSSFSRDAEVLPVLRAGALSYLLKDIAPQGLVDAMRLAARGQPTLHPQIAKRVLQTLRNERIDSASLLSERELMVLRAVGNGLSNQEIATQFNIGERTVKTHVSNILSKLGLRDRTQAAVFAWREGLQQPSATDASPPTT